MEEAKFIGPTEEREHSEYYELPLGLEKIQAGFPTPNGGQVDSKLDLNEFCIPHPNSCYIFQVAGESMIEAGIMPGDYLIIDRAKEAKNGDIVIAAVNGEYTVKYIEFYPRPRLIPANKNFPEIILKEGMQCEIEGVVISTVRKYS
ncbi:MAG: translesion error-prone DNA polymerase V autoproteolytic subunit [Succinivibrionaceae bacterium]|nr:translesion error-prone DNA polymerase V autoproteolytic subunit [Ruminobacter sp.]MDY5780070.1 translesion error-prone DNA polymerase V autoproteolytic subunit [Succinivibrionaceae bacterium]MEE1339235.1 translesion error-prone DNA polymerase V autoproteolytic subunit [Succinivibrionaceae bacterium]